MGMSGNGGNRQAGERRRGLTAISSGADGTGHPVLAMASDFQTQGQTRKLACAGMSRSFRACHTPARDPSGVRRLWVSLGRMLLLLLLGQPERLLGETGSVNHRVGAGLAMDVDTRWVDNGGYRPVRITFTPTAPVVADRVLVIEFVAPFWSNSGLEQTRVVQAVEIPAGSGPVRVAISVPQMVTWNQFRVDVTEDGQLVQPLSVLSAGGAAAASDSLWAEQLPAVLIVGDKLPDTANLARLVRVDLYYQNASGPTPSGGKLPLPTAMARPLAELPERWIDYTNFDLVSMSFDQLR